MASPRRTRSNLVLVCLGALLGGCRGTPAPALRLVPQTGPVQPRRVDLSRGDGTRLLVVEASGRVGVWSLGEGSAPALLASVAAGAVDATFAPGGRSLLTAGFDGRVRRWTTDGRLVWASQGGHDGPARAVVENAGLVVSGGDDGALRRWTPDGAPLGPPLGGHVASVLSLAVSPRGDIVSVAGDGTVRRWQRSEGASGRPPTFQPSILSQDVAPLDPQAAANQVRYDATWGWQRITTLAPDGTLIAAAPFDGSVRLWNADGTPHAAIPNAHARRHVGALAFAPRDGLLASAGSDGTLRLWNLDGSARGQPIRAHTNLVFSVGFSADGRLIVTAGSDDRVRLWRSDGSAVGELPLGPSRPPTAFAVAPVAPMLAIAADEHVGVWHLDAAGRGAVIQGAQTAALAFGPRPDLLAVGGLGTVRLFSPSGAARGEPFTGGDVPVAALAFAPTDGRLAAAGEALRMFAPDTLLWQAPAVAPDSLTTVAFSPDGAHVATGSLLGRIQVWTRDGAPRMAPLKLPRQHIRALAFIDSGQGFATAGGGENVIRLWRLDGSVLAPPLEGHLGAVSALTSSADATLMASGSDDGTVRLWHLAPRQSESIDVGLPINQLGFWRNALWVRAGGTSLFVYDRHRQLVATAALGTGAPLVITPDGWFAGPHPAPGALLGFDSAGDRLSDEATAQRFAPERVWAALLRATE